MIDRLTTRAIAAIACAHARGVCFGQVVPRNITLDDACQVGLLDVEEDLLDFIAAGADPPLAAGRLWHGDI